MFCINNPQSLKRVINDCIQINNTIQDRMNIILNNTFILMSIQRELTIKKTKNKKKYLKLLLYLKFALKIKAEYKVNII